MCANCFTALDSLAVHTTGATVVAVSGWQSVRMRLLGMDRVERRQARWLREARFMAELGHDPVVVLGPPPGDREDRSAAVAVAPTIRA